MSTMTPSRIALLREIAERATPGLREARAFARSGDTEPWHRWRIFLRGAPDSRTNSRDYDWTEGDARLIAAFDRETCLALLARAEQADALARTAKDAIRLADELQCVAYRKAEADGGLPEAEHEATLAEIERLREALDALTSPRAEVEE